MFRGFRMTLSAAARVKSAQRGAVSKPAITFPESEICDFEQIVGKPEVIALERTPSSPIGPRNGLRGSCPDWYREVGLQKMLPGVGIDCGRVTRNSGTLLPSINQCRYISPAEAIVDIYYADVRGTGVHHSQQRRQPFKGRAVSYAGRDCHHRYANQASDHAG